MKRLRYSLLAAAGILILAFVLTAVGPKRVMAALGYTPVRDVDSPGRQPFVRSFSIQIPPNIIDGFSDSVTTPAGKRLVIETISSDLGVLPAGQRFGVQLFMNAPSGQQLYGVPMSFDFTSSGFDRWNAFQSGHIYAEPGTQISFRGERSSAAGTAVIDITISGYLIDLP